MQNFKDSYSLLSKVGACKMVSGIPELTKELMDIINDDKRRAKMGAASLQVIKGNRGAAVRSIEYLEDLLRITTVPATIMSRYPTNIRNLNDEGGISLRHADYIIQYVYQMVHGTETPFMGSVLLVVLRFFLLFVRIWRLQQIVAV